MKLFKSVEKKKFTLAHCWRILRSVPKWAEYVAKRNEPKVRRTTIASSAPVAAPTPDAEDEEHASPHVRPPGRKQEKARAQSKRPSEEYLEMLSKRHSSVMQNGGRYALAMERRTDVELATFNRASITDPMQLEAFDILVKRMVLRLREEEGRNLREEDNSDLVKEVTEE
ncbi:hypothetical protein BX666DRAFT_413926 [Dichotomocladium elegans]|nr:hypothetical protein BX666DRAFT_940790 [Dichotomocladium elegans]KAI9314802.1 hypothetical protein BX666DRAFT_413926 [Dichotomocladium elegans]